MTAGASLEVRDLAKSFGRQPVLAGLSLSVDAGCLTAILGPSGSGKTTLLRVLAGFERADGGVVCLGGRTVDDGSSCYVAPEHRHVGYVPQEGSLFPHLTVARNVGFGMTRRRRRQGAVAELLEMVGMADMDRRYPHELSGGQQQRVALARALAVGPSLVLLDEPFSALDAALRAATRAEVREVLRRAGATALLVTHDQDEALSWADQVAVIDQGRIGQLDSPHRLYARPADATVARFVGEANLVAGTVGAQGVATLLGCLAADGALPAVGTAVTVLVRPEQIVLAPVPAEGEVERASPLASVAAYEYFGHDAIVRLVLDAAGGTDATHATAGTDAAGSTTGAMDAGGDRLVVRVVGDSVWAPGDRAAVAVRGRVRVFPAGADNRGVTTRV